MKKAFLFFVLSLFFYFSLGWNRNLTGIKIISRQQWGANPAYLFSDYPYYFKLIKKNEEYEKKAKQNPEKYWRYFYNKEVKKVRISYMLKHWANELKKDKVEKKYNGKELWWPFSYKRNKTKIIVHHTAVNYNRFKKQADVLPYLRWVYRFHALTRGWGDIGYNFLIDPWGNIYEGKAGGPGIIGANSKWNNNQSIGIALIGNFQIQKPTQAQIDSLIKLSIALAKKYHINPYTVQTYHKEISYYPYIQDVTGYSIVGHRDTGNTVCPGKYLYAKLPYVRKKVYEAVKPYLKKWEKQKYKLLFYKTLFSFDNTINVFVSGDVKNCKVNSGFVVNCKKNLITITEKKVAPIIFRLIKVYFSLAGKNYFINVKGIFLPNIREIVKQNVEKQYHFDVKKIKKITYKWYVKNMKNIYQLPMRVLLYNLTFDFTGYKISCDGSCKLYLDKKNLVFTGNFYVRKKQNSLEIILSGNKFYSSGLVISGNLIRFDNYHRKSYLGIGWNEYKGKILIKKAKARLINGNYTNEFLVINKLSLWDYLNGIAESNDVVPFEKTKVMALLAKDYALFYRNKKNHHNFIPQDSIYNAIDDPRMFQLYVGAGFEKTSKNWKKALLLTKNQVLVYSGYIPILPYFNCSRGFTFSAYQRLGRIDTPYLVNNVDIAKCDKFIGHGVGLSGKGAEALAKKGLNYLQIIKWYFPGVKVVSLNN